MSDSFGGSDSVRLQPGDSNVPLIFRFKPASASTANDGSIPYGSTIKAVSKVYTKFSVGGTSSTAMVKSVKLSSNVVQVFLNYTTALPTGLHYMTVKLSVKFGSTSFVKQFDFNRIYMKEISTV